MSPWLQASPPELVMVLVSEFRNTGGTDLGEAINPVCICVIPKPRSVHYTSLLKNTANT